MNYFRFPLVFRFSAEFVQNGGQTDVNELFHHISSQGAVVLMLAKRVLELEALEGVAAELKAIKEMYNLP